MSGRHCLEAVGLVRSHDVHFTGEQCVAESRKNIRCIVGLSLDSLTLSVSQAFSGKGCGQELSLF